MFRLLLAYCKALTFVFSQLKFAPLVPVAQGEVKRLLLHSPDSVVKIQSKASHCI